MNGWLLDKKLVRKDTYWMEFAIGGDLAAAAGQNKAPLAGQFYLIKPKLGSVFLARPFGVFHYDSDGESISFLIEKRGQGTEEITSMVINEEAMIFGPLGNTFIGAMLTWEKGKNGAKNADGTRPKQIKKIALVSGGTGFAPLSFFASQNTERCPEKDKSQNRKFEIDFYCGFKEEVSFNKDRFLLSRALSSANNLTLASESGGNADNRGFITDFFSPENYDAVLSCGPLPMMEKVAAMCKEYGVPCFVSIEKKMACGAGVCLGCVIETKSGNKRCCKDGPVFNANELFWGPGRFD